MGPARMFEGFGRGEQQLLRVVHRARGHPCGLRDVTLRELRCRPRQAVERGRQAVWQPLALLTEDARGPATV
eukprot:8544910-Alexandrium_andersonii.AAC.1